MLFLYCYDQETSSSYLWSGRGRGVVCNAVHVICLGLLRGQVGGTLVEVLINESLRPVHGGKCVDCRLGLEGPVVVAPETKRQL